MKAISVLIPTYHRPHKLKALIQNFNQCSSEAELVFICDHSDLESSSLLRTLGQVVLPKAGEYKVCINYGVEKTKTPFIFCGADDIAFTPHWDKKLLRVMDDPCIMVTGGIDDWPISKSGVHTSHPMLRRSYITEFGGNWNCPGKVYWEGYKHYQGDIELEQLAWTRGVIKICKECLIPHNHFINQKAERDATYQHSVRWLEDDTKRYNERKHLFEHWVTDDLHHGIARENPNRMKRLSIILPVYNALSFTLQTLENLQQTTMHKYELILIDDASTEFDGQKQLSVWKQQAYDCGWLQVITRAHKKQQFTNATWSEGVSVATGDYVAILNNDIKFHTDEWDDYLIEDLDMGFELANPFQQDSVYPKPYMKPPHEDYLFRLNIRGAGFMMSKDFAKNAFPIPKRLTHWFGDNYLSQQLKTYTYDIRVVMEHFISQSGRTVDQEQFWRMVYKDAQSYHSLYPYDDISPVEANITERLKQYGTNL